ncbi:MAG: metallophosphoesterase [Pseudomonadota bacterium]
MPDPRRRPTRRRFLQTFGLSALFAGMLGSYAAAIEPLYRLNTTRYRLRPAGWPRGLDLRIAVIADLHACRPWMDEARIAQVVTRTNALAPDLVLLLGDFVSGLKAPFVRTQMPAEIWAEALAKLQAPLGRYAVLGNHDWWDDAAGQWLGRGPTPAQAALERVGIPVLENTCLRLTHKESVFWLAGLGDQMALLPGGGGSGRRGRGRDDLPGTLRQITDDAPIILMAHEPDIFPQVVRAPRPVSLTLSGHTHGGQVRAFGYAPVVPSRFRNRYAYGHKVEVAPDGTPRDLVVSGGLGCSIAPVRFGVPPEILLLTLGARDDSEMQVT